MVQQRPQQHARHVRGVPAAALVPVHRRASRLMADSMLCMRKLPPRLVSLSFGPRCTESNGEEALQYQHSHASPDRVWPFKACSGHRVARSAWTEAT